jgi:4-hydroxy-tetrahydrodipicolinate synthase
VAESVTLPILIYNVPSRTITDISVETIDRLARDCPNIIGIKDATADLTRPSRQRMATGEAFIQVSGEDGTALAFNAHGGTGAFRSPPTSRPGCARSSRRRRCAATMAPPSSCRTG